MPSQLKFVHGKTVQEIKYITSKQYSKLKTIDDQSEYTKTSELDYIDVIGNHPTDMAFYKIVLKDMPITAEEYKPRYKDDMYDPVKNPRYSIRPTMLPDLLKSEKECVKDLYTIGAELRNYIGARLLSRLENARLLAP